MSYSTTPSRALLIDLDGVLRRWPENDSAIEQRFGLPIGCIRKTAFDGVRLTPAITGRISDEQWRQQIAAALANLHPGADCASAVMEWSAKPGTLDRAVLDLLRSAARSSSAQLVLVTNATTRLRQDLEVLGLGLAFDVVVNSSELGHAKPDSAIFAAALAAAGCAASEALFVDDSLQNVEAALRLGIKAHRYQGIDGLVDFLVDVGALPNAA